ncbi:response regulator transcription factor [Lysinibacillus sp. NPDC096418]|uniref:response regulator transcription factor n=1 Tax=Lysinibacillus sp. NPDC096418 TaxID=3364138 RepID=UPI003805E1BE
MDDEPQIRQLIRLHIEQAGMKVVEADSGRLAIEQLQAQYIDLMILDLMMDDVNGFEVLNYIQDHRLETLIIVLSARREEQDKILTLGLGADDYVAKPFSPLELTARVQAHLRRHHFKSPQKTAGIRLNNLLLDVDNYELLNDGKQHTLTPIECQLLRFFMLNPDRVMTKREIYQQVWQHDRYDDNNLSVFINRLRKLLENNDPASWKLLTVRGVGYWLTRGRL